MSKGGVGAPVVSLADVREGRIKIPTTEEKSEATAAAQEAKENARAENAAAIKAGEDSTRQYSPLVEQVKRKYDALFFSEGMHLDVHATANPDRPLYVFEVDDKHRGSACVGYHMITIDLSKPFSDQWSKEWDALAPESVYEISKGNGMLADGSMLMQHARAVKAAEETPPPHDPDALRLALADMHKGLD